MTKYNLFYLCFFSFVIWALPANSQTKTLQFGPFYANIQVDFESTCFYGELLEVKQKTDGCYYFGEDAEVMDGKITLNSPYIKDFKVFKRTTFAYGYPSETEGVIFYRDWRPEQRYTSKTLFCSEWTELILKNSAFTPENKAPRWPDDAFLETCPIQAKIDTNKMYKFLTPRVNARWGTRGTVEEMTKAIAPSIDILKEAVEIQIRYKEGNESKAVTIIFFNKWGEC